MPQLRELVRTSTAHGKADRSGQTRCVRGGVPMAPYVTGKGIRRALVLIIHPTGQALGTTYDGWQPTNSCLKAAL